MDDLMFTPADAYSKPWTFITSGFLHFDFRHLLFNMIALFFFGLYLESRVGRGHFLAAFFVAAVIGNVGYMVTAPNPFIPGLGASGAVYGVMGALAAIAPLAIVYVSFVPMPMVVAAAFWALSEFLGLFVPGNIARGAHLGGLFFGIAYGIYLRSQVSRKPVRISRVSYV